MMRCLFNALLITSFAAACSSAPLHHYTLSSSVAENGLGQRHIIQNPSGNPLPLNIVINPVTLPDIVDRPQLVTLSGENAAEIHETHRWASSLKQSIPGVVAQNLSKMLESAHVAVGPQYVISDPDYTVQLDIQRFDSIPSQGVRVDVLWTVRHLPSGATRSDFNRLEQAYTGAGFDEIAAAHSRALVLLSDNIAREILSMSTSL